MFFRRISRMKRREKEHKNLKMKGGVLSVWFKIKNIKSFNRHPPGCYQKIRENILKCQSYTALVLPIFLYLMLGVLFFVQFMETAGATEQKIHDRAKQMAVYAYDLRQITDQDFHLGYSAFSGKEDEIDLVAAYRISSQMPVFSFGKPQIIQRGFVRAWTGRDFRKELQKEGNEESKEKVFVTAHGTVYHKSLKCTHLRLSVEQTTVTQAEARRNRYGAKYYACSCCKSGVGAAVYITDTGNRYHARLSCSGLKRTIREIPLSEAGKRKACSKCGG